MLSVALSSSWALIGVNTAWVHVSVGDVGSGSFVNLRLQVWSLCSHFYLFCARRAVPVRGSGFRG
jgi:hypothetical protein